MTSFEVVPDELTTHAGRLDALTDRLSTTLSAANTVSMDTQAYGLLCAFLPPIVNPVEQKGMDAIRAASEGVSTTADNVRAAADAYRETEQSNTEPLNQQHDDLTSFSVPTIASS
ncbi:type VII secretion target [Amycolatopsis taiwanensis]|uniref:ESX-1 secretion-associated protein n=1 Tax=Amycolatopsis taiwanensis TaxID=342230 RepID=A0A9W6VGR8_9PSEU|nr:type VII secretion target [Amycolatopsis taiwanensis]GLY66742.1 hypothetical protein Atai01_33610 [Amycolatopsis taiwanensis]